MARSQVVRRAAADDDIDGIVDHYLVAGGAALALKFIDVLEAAYTLIGRQPGIGSPRLGLELNVPGLRAWPLNRFPHIVFYVEKPEQVEVWRVLHGKGDLPAWLQLPDG